MHFIHRNHSKHREIQANRIRLVTGEHIELDCFVSFELKSVWFCYPVQWLYLGNNITNGLQAIDGATKVERVVPVKLRLTAPELEESDLELLLDSLRGRTRILPLYIATHATNRLTSARHCCCSSTARARALAEETGANLATVFFHHVHTVEGRLRHDLVHVHLISILDAFRRFKLWQRDEFIVRVTVADAG